MPTVNRSEAGFYEVGDDGSNFKGVASGAFTSIDGWTDSSSGGGYIIIAESEGGHSKVPHLFSGGGTAQMYTTFDDQDKGCIEGWLRPGGSGMGGRVYVRNDSTEIAELRLSFSGGSLVRVKEAGGYTADLADWSVNNWYHFGMAWRSTGAAAYSPYGIALAEGEFLLEYRGNTYGPYDMINDTDVNKIIFYCGNYTMSFDAFAFDWDTGGYAIEDNYDLAVDVTISNSDISQLEIHHPTTLERATVRFGKETYGEWFPICVARIKSTEEIYLGAQIEITETHTSAGATASEVIFKGEVIKKLTSKVKNYEPLYLIYSNAKEMNVIKPSGSYTKDTDGYISDILTNDCDKLTEGTLSDGMDLGTFTAAGDKSFTLIIRQCARLDGFIAYIDASAGADNANLMYDDGSTDTGVNIDESSSTLRGLRRVEVLDEHVNRVTVRGGIQSDGTRATGTANNTESQDLYGIVPTYDSDTNLNTDALCLSKATQILADNEFGNRRVVIGYKDATKGMLQPGETVTFDWDHTVHDIGFDIGQEQYIIALNKYDVKTGVNVLTLYSSIYYGAISDSDLLQETSHIALQNTNNIATWLAIGSGNAREKHCIPIGCYSYTYIRVADGHVVNTLSNDFTLECIVPLSPTMGSLKLYITKIIFYLSDADSNDYVKNTYLYDAESKSALETDETDYDTIGEKTFTFAAARDCSSYNALYVRLEVESTTSGEFEVTGIRVQYYYDT